MDEWIDEGIEVWMKWIDIIMNARIDGWIHT
jgi:hypothetical protein